MKAMKIVIEIDVPADESFDDVITLLQRNAGTLSDSAWALSVGEKAKIFDIEDADVIGAWEVQS